MAIVQGQIPGIQEYSQLNISDPATTRKVAHYRTSRLSIRIQQLQDATGSRTGIASHQLLLRQREDQCTIRIDGPWEHGKSNEQPCKQLMCGEDFAAVVSGQVEGVARSFASSAAEHSYN
jgi:hypothetical protein